MANKPNWFKNDEYSIANDLYSENFETYIIVQAAYKTTDKKYILENGSFDDLKFETDFLNYFRNMIVIMQNAKGSNGDLLFPSLEWTEMKSSGKVESILDKQMEELNK